LPNPRSIGLVLGLVFGLSTGCSVCLLSPPPPRSYTVDLVDVDSDGDVDAVVGNGPGNVEYVGEPNAVWLNDGAGHFTDSGQRMIGSGGTVWSITYAVALGDLDGDGDLDAFVSNGRTVNPDEVWFNDGAGHFTDSGQRFSWSRHYAVDLADVNGDGDRDIFAIHFNGGCLVWHNDGSGRFSRGEDGAIPLVCLAAGSAILLGAVVWRASQGKPPRGAHTP
jgi:hypothetical protein